MSRAEKRREVVLDALYRKSAELAKRYYYPFRRPRVTVGGLPVFLLLGNHSSGKSSLINSVLGGDAVQDVGVAPTDDGFTFILFGEEERDVVGAAALAMLPKEYKGLGKFGAAFLQHLKVKVRNREALKRFVVIDSPGMIDATDAKRDRDYNFAGVVRRLSELADEIFFLFDPDKPGTTGETVKIFAECLADLQYKLRVILNKCDLFSNELDFARAYGTLCWNLSRVMTTKDLPKIVTLYKTTPSEEVAALFADSSMRRSDNIYAQAAQDFLGLSIRMGVINAAMSRVSAIRWAVPFFWFGGEMFLRRRQAKKVDAIFAEVFRDKLATQIHDDLTSAWTAQRESTAEVLAKAPLDLPWFAEMKRKRIERRLKRLIGEGVS